jgi:L-asparaginase/Glu-tRNA(Gln) amidotransferase subunit D
MYREQGLVIAAGDLSPQRARVLLMLALLRTSDDAELRRIFTTY